MGADDIHSRILMTGLVSTDYPHRYCGMPNGTDYLPHGYCRCASNHGYERCHSFFFLTARLSRKC